MQLKNSAKFDSGKLWQKLSRFAVKAGRELVEKVLWLYYAAQRPETPMWAKSVIYGALAYFILPTDAVPDFLPVTGFTDDMGALLAAVSTVSMYIDDSVKARAKARLKRWFPEPATETGDQRRLQRTA